MMMRKRHTRAWTCVSVPLWLGVTHSRGPLLTSSCGPKAFWRNTLLWVGARFPFVSPTHKSMPVPSSLSTSHPVAVTRAVPGATAKLTRISFSFFTISRLKDSFLPWSWVTWACDVFLSLLSPELSACHLREALSGCSLAYENRQPRYSRIRGTQLSKIGVTWTQALGYLNHGSHRRGGRWMTS